MQIFWSDSDCKDKIDIKKIKKIFFQFLALPKERQKFGEVQKKCLQIFSKLFFIY